MKITKKRIYDVVTRSKASQNKVELTKLLELLTETEINVVLEIGSHQGYSLNLWQDAFTPELLIGIEPSISGVKFEELTDNALIIGGYSQEQTTFKSVKSLLGDRLIDFLFIDGDHTFMSVKQDYNGYLPLVRKGGVIVFHDIVTESGVREFWTGIEENIKDFDIITHEHGDGYAVIFK